MDGTGGRFVEIYEDVERILLPATDQEIKNMIRKTRVGKIIEGCRGIPPLNIKRLQDFLKLVSAWMLENPDLESLDFNPVRLFCEDMVVLDSKAKLSSYLEGRDGS